MKNVKKLSTIAYVRVAWLADIVHTIFECVLCLQCLAWCCYAPIMRWKRGGTLPACTYDCSVVYDGQTLVIMLWSPFLFMLLDSSRYDVHNCFGLSIQYYVCQAVLKLSLVLLWYSRPSSKRSLPATLWNFLAGESEQMGTQLCRWRRGSVWKGTAVCPPRVSLLMQLFEKNPLCCY